MLIHTIRPDSSLFTLSVPIPATSTGLSHKNKNLNIPHNVRAKNIANNLVGDDKSSPEPVAKALETDR